MKNYLDLYNFDPLTDVTRRERRTLILVTLIALAISKLALYPTKITALGIDFAANVIDIKLLMPLYFRYVISFLLVTFFVYAVSDFVRSWVVRYQTNFDLAVSSNTEPMQLTPESERRFEEQKLNHPPFRSLRKSLFLIRGAIEFIFPMMFAGYGLYAI